MKKLIVVTMVVLFVFMGVTFAIQFSDIEGHWAKEYVEKLVDFGIINGYEDGTFRPQGKIKKGEFLKLLMTASYPENDWDSEITTYNHWSSLYIEAAEESGILQVRRNQ